MHALGVRKKREEQTSEPMSGNTSFPRKGKYQRQLQSKTGTTNREHTTTRPQSMKRKKRRKKKEQIKTGMYRRSCEIFNFRKRRKRGNNLRIIILKFVLMDNSKGFLNKEEIMLDHFCPILNVPDFLQFCSSSICHATPLTGSLPEGSGTIP